MCIRDRTAAADPELFAALKDLRKKIAKQRNVPPFVVFQDCLLYTSDAADERSSVDLGGRRIIKKKNYADSRDRRINQHTRN